MVCIVWCLVGGGGGGGETGKIFNHFKKKTALLLLFHQYYITFMYKNFLRFADRASQYIYLSN